MTLLGDLAAGRVEGGVLAVPLGSTEQHGPHLRLSTDTEIAIELARRLAAAVERVVVAPAVAYGSSGEHEGFAGTISIGQEALELIIVEVGRSASATFDRIVFISAHGGNADPLRRATRRLLSESRDVLALSPRWSGDAHTGRAETSIMLALRPGQVDLARAKTGNIAPMRELVATLRSGGVRAVSSNGVLGDAAGASVQEVRRLLAAAADDSVAEVSAR
jgi:creatinine amidohydrolase